MNGIALRSAYFVDWKGGPTFLIWGNSEGMINLRDWLRLAPNAGALAQFCHSADGKEISIKVVVHERDAGMRIGQVGLEWSLSPALAADFADKIEALVASASGHQYLDARGNNVTVEVSIGEYPEDLSPA